MPEYKDTFPFLKCRSCKLFFNSNYLVACVDYDVHMNLTLFGVLEDSDLIKKAEKFSRTYGEDFCLENLKSELGDMYFSNKRFTYVCLIKQGKISSGLFQEMLCQWLEMYVLPNIEENNRKKVHDALQTPININIGYIQNNIWVIEEDVDNVKEPSYKQGTAFYMKDVGCVTCAHVLSDKMVAFTYKNPWKKIPVSVIKKNDVLDIALLDINPEVKPEGFEKGDSDAVKYMDNITLAGFPNYRLGDSGIVTPGIISGFRPSHGVQRMLTNANIIAGNSGGPVLDKEHKVIGIAVTGAEDFASTRDTEDYGIIPINVIDLLLS